MTVFPFSTVAAHNVIVNNANRLRIVAMEVFLNPLFPEPSVLGLEETLSLRSRLWTLFWFPVPSCIRIQPSAGTPSLCLLTEHQERQLQNLSLSSPDELQQKFNLILQQANFLY